MITISRLFHQFRNLGGQIWLGVYRLLVPYRTVVIEGALPAVLGQQNSVRGPGRRLPRTGDHDMPVRLRPGSAHEPSS